ncbi:hypothetical protein BK764_12885 [Bacillus thuringiensis serovar israelensis]|uniref:Uncharacterized protein n=2 Tax=Bacillus thuringiensis TaxID=1428 RepID=A0A7D3Z5G1_BACTU|nr:hypothetical protein ATN07_31235 [Bacillus thuringiensis serovar israelensis]EAO56488.1 hypothetical protein RBTH_07533 [Bacillus thuringiensis serovar israelensis ATCC 35646]EEM74572.1 hypothetical protein bthur0010_54870 [Bacillus thuringiensis serovar pondicheriensis BGSC 4BA1]EEN00014.1 hypothetical protein bthur0014_55090 [Bacillus thuringiensis IBL 4222]KAA8487005.1 hypothetical protein FYW98_16845 [Bacillus thuringiensis]KRD81005.1 hypothetical protein ASE53_17945 [Bacillus sp. Root1
MSPEGVLFQLFITEGTFHKKRVDIVPFEVSENTNSALQTGYPITSVLYRNRVFSSVEEVIVIPRSPLTYYSLNPVEVRRLDSKASSLKRLANVIIITDVISFKDFVQKNIEALEDPYTLLTENPKANLGNHKAIKYVKDWYKHTSLRPQYYSLDETDKRLHKYFKDVREKCSNKRPTPLSVQEKVAKEEKEEKPNETVEIDTLTSYLVLSRGIQMGLVNRDNPRMQMLKPFLSEVKNQPNEKFNVDKGSRFAKRLDTLGYYSETGSADASKLREVLFVDTVLTARKTIRAVEQRYPLWGSHLIEVTRNLLPSNGAVTNEKAQQLRELVGFEYRNEIDTEIVFSNVFVTAEQVERLQRGIKLDAEELEDLKRLILFDVGLTEDTPHVDLLILHDLYIYCNNIPHRQYNSALKHENSDIKGYVTNQSIAERICFVLQDEIEEELDTIVEEIQDEQLENDGPIEDEVNEEEENEENTEDDHQWDLCGQYVSSLNEVEHKAVWKTLSSELQSELQGFMNCNPRNRKEEVVSFIVDLINRYEYGGVNKAGTMAHSINVLYRRGIITKGTRLGCKGYKTNRFANRLFDSEKEIDEEYSRYMYLLKRLYER